MAAVFDSDKAPSVKRIDDFMIDPREVQLSPEFNGRHEHPPIDDLMEGFLDVGQIQSCLIGREGGIPMLKAGHRRWRTALKLTELKKGPFEGGVFKLRCRYYVGSEVDCFIATIQENSDRVETKPIDDAFNIVKLKRLGLSDEDIARRVYRKKNADGSPNVKWVEDTAALIELGSDAMERLNNGTLKPNAAVELAKLSKQAQKSALAANPGKLTVAAIKRAAAPVPRSDADAAPANAQAKRKPLKTADLCAILDRYQASEWPKHILMMTVENALRTVLGQIQDEIECGQ